MSSNKQNRQLLDTSRTDTNSQYQDFLSGQKTRMTNDQSDADSLRKTIQGSYTNNNNFMAPGLTPNSNGWFDLSKDTSSGGGGLGLAAGGDFSSAKKGYQGFADTGGVNRGDFQPALDSYKGFMSNGGLSQSDTDNIRYRATSQVPAFYNQYKNQLARRQNVQGGYSPGYDAQQAEIGRDSARQGYDASRQAEGDIVDRSIQGKEFGTAGFGNLMSDITGKEQSGKLAGLGGLKGIGDSEQQNSQFNSSLGEQQKARNQQMQQFLQSLYSEGGKTNASGLQGLYSSAPGNVGQSQGNYLAGLGGMSQAQLSNLALRTGMKGIDWAKWAQVAGTTAGAAAMASDKNIKENINPVDMDIVSKFKSIPISTWNYIGDEIKHIGPMAQDMQEVFGIGDGKTINLVDVMGLLMLLGKSIAMRIPNEV